MEETNQMLAELFTLVPMEKIEECVVHDYIMSYSFLNFFHQYPELELSEKTKERIGILKATAQAAIQTEEDYGEDAGE